MATIKADQLAQEIIKVLDDYRDATVDRMKDSVDKAAKEAVSELKTSSPKRTGAYAKDWAAKKDKQTNKWAYGKVVYNKKHYRLTHLLEKGHRKVNGGKVAARPHIAKVEEKAINTLVEGIKNDS
jgi:hypothetical protein